MKRRTIPRIDILKSFCPSECVDDCGGEWLRCAQITLEKNNLPKAITTAIVFGLGHDHGKGKIIWLLDQPTAGKYLF